MAELGGVWGGAQTKITVYWSQHYGDKDIINNPLFMTAKCKIQEKERTEKLRH